jgi:hypothetical protein
MFHNRLGVMGHYYGGMGRKSAFEGVRRRLGLPDDDDH